MKSIGSKIEPRENTVSQVNATAKSQSIKMAPFRYIAPAIALALLATPASAITAKDVLEKMSEKERYGYVSGLFDMLSYQAVLAGNQSRAQCISTAFYTKTKETWQSVLTTFEKFNDKAPEGLVVVLMNRACGAN